MKVLALNLFFQLPDNFNGSPAEAIKLFADYYIKGENKKSNVIMKNGQGKLTPRMNYNQKGSYTRQWNLFLDVLKEDKKFLGLIDVAKQHGKKMISIYKKEKK